MQKITPFLWFDDQAEQAIEFYTSIFKNSKIGSVTRLSDEVPGPKGKVLTATFQLAGREFMALNGGPQFTFSPATSFFVLCQTEEEIDELWARLSQGGKVFMELGKYPFSQKFGWVEDRFHLSWQLNLVGLPQAVIPFLTFVGEQAGKAEQAIHFYTALFKDSNIFSIERYGSNQPQPQGMVQHASFSLNGENFMAMDSGLKHDFTFTLAVSFFVSCQTQSEVDYFWEGLSAQGGEKSQCGWLKDKFGVSWQIVPTLLGELLNDPDREKVRRVTQAMLQMTKIDIDKLEQAYRQVE